MNNPLVFSDDLKIALLNAQMATVRKKTIMPMIITDHLHSIHETLRTLPNANSVDDAIIYINQWCEVINKIKVILKVSMKNERLKLNEVKTKLEQLVEKLEAYKPEQDE